MKTSKPVCGKFSNGMAYAKVGNGSKKILFVPGGPGNAEPDPKSVKMIIKSLHPVLEHDYTLWVVARKQNMPQGYRVGNMAADYADLIESEFDGKIDLYVGESYGGMIGFYMAANHSDCFSSIAIVVAAYTISDFGKECDYDMARYTTEGKTWLASKTLQRVLWPKSRIPLLSQIAGYVFLKAFNSKLHPYFNSDVMIEAEAEKIFNCKEILSEIAVPVLLLTGDQDVYFPVELCRETASLIPDCHYITYKGAGHLEAALDKRVAQDILDFAGRNGTGI